MDLRDLSGRFFSSFASLVEALEESDQPFFYTVVAFYAIVSLRIFIEILVVRGAFRPGLFLHWYLYWTIVTLPVTYILSWVTGTSLGETARVTFPGSVLFLIPPILDFILNLGGLVDINYILPGRGDLLTAFFGFLDAPGITTGMRVEIFLILLSIFGYIYLKRENYLLSFVTTATIYVLAFSAAMAPIIVKFIVEFLEFKYSYSANLMSEFYLILGFPLVLLTLRKANMDICWREKFWGLLPIQSAFWGGVLLSTKFVSHLGIEAILATLTLSMAIILLWVLWRRISKLEELDLETGLLAALSTVYSLPVGGKASLPLLATASAFLLSELPPFKLGEKRLTSYSITAVILFSIFAAGFLSLSDIQRFYSILSLV